MANILQVLPELEGMEMTYVQTLIKDMNDEQVQLFANAYRSRRKDPLLILLTCLIGFLGFAGIHRFIIGHAGMGILYLLTAGICFIGTIIDIVNYKNITFEYNQAIAQQVASLMRSSN